MNKPDSGKFRFSLSAWAAMLIALLYIFYTIINPPGNILSWDVFGYYLYLPAVFIHGDIGYHDISVVERIIEQYNNTGSLYQLSGTPTGAWVNKYPMGIAIMYMPFFLIGHMIAIFSSYAADGYSLPYQYAIIYGSMLYVLAGIYFLRKVSLELFPDVVAALVLIVVFFSTNYVAQVINGMAMPHIYLFALYAIIIWLTILWNRQPRIRYAIWLGIVLGLCILSRPSEIVCLIIPIFWGVSNREQLSERMNLFKKHWKHLLAIGLIMLAIGSLQFFYWNHTVGKFLYNSYTNPGEGFEFFSPFITQVLFSFRKGWLIYTPVMIFALLGFYFAFRENKGTGMPVLLFFLLNLYIVASWSCWWYGDSFGQRALIQSYAVMAIPLGYFIKYMLTRKDAYKYSFLILTGLLLALNLFQTWQLQRGIIHSSRMTRPYYFATFLSPEPDGKKQELLLVNRPGVVKEQFTSEAQYKRRLLITEDFESSGLYPDTLLNPFSDFVSRSGNYSFLCDSENNYSPVFSKSFKDLTVNDHAWLRISLWVYPVHPMKENPGSLVVAFEHKHREYKFRTLNFESLDLQLNQWNKIRFDYLTPEVRNKKDALRVYYWHRGQNEIYLDDLMIEIFEP